MEIQRHRQKRDSLLMVICRESLNLFGITGTVLLGGMALVGREEKEMREETKILIILPLGGGIFMWNEEKQLAISYLSPFLSPHPPWSDVRTSNLMREILKCL